MKGKEHSNIPKPEIDSLEWGGENGNGVRQVKMHLSWWRAKKRGWLEIRYEPIGAEVDAARASDKAGAAREAGKDF